MAHEESVNLGLTQEVDVCNAGGEVQWLSNPKKELRGLCWGSKILRVITNNFT